MSVLALTAQQFKRMADTVNALGLSAFVGGAGDAIVNGTRPMVDRVGIGVGVLLLVLSVHLSRWEKPEPERRIGLTHSRARR